MPTSIRSYAKINLGLRIGAHREDGFHELRTVYQTIALHDVIRVQAGRGMGIEIRCKNPKVPQDETNTCWRVTERVLKTLKKRAKVTIAITKNLPVQGGLGAGSSNGLATMLALEKELGEPLAPVQKLEIAAAVGSDLPLFLVGGTILGIGRGEQVFPLPDLTSLPCVIATPPIAVSTPKAFADWDEKFADESAESGKKLTANSASGTIDEFSTSVFAWLMGTTAGVPAKSGDRAETPLLDLVRAGIENDFERVVFPQYPELRDVKRVLEREGAKYASLSGSGSTVYGLFETAEAAEKAAAKLEAKGVPAQASKTIGRAEYWRDLVIG
jgi:4-diphosphocytidyl-2-C-methyl-D-erythritol kinase